jgi:hypothetical protein
VGHPLITRLQARIDQAVERHTDLEDIRRILYRGGKGSVTPALVSPRDCGFTSTTASSGPTVLAIMSPPDAAKDEGARQG